MTNASDRELPVSFWGPVEGAPATSYTPTPAFDEHASWRESFALHGLTPEDALILYSGETSTLLGGRTMHTLDDIFKHLQAKVNGPAPVEPPPPAEPTVADMREDQREKRKQERAEKEARIEAARIQWKQAIEMQEAAMKQWKQYVKDCHAYFTSVRNS